MDLMENILYDIVQKKIEVYFSDFDSINELFSLECYKMLDEIKNIIKEDDLEDNECFSKIEAIIRVFEEKGIDTGTRHDF